MISAILILIFVIGGSQAISQTVAPVRVVVMPFEDRAGFQGKWDLSKDVPKLLAANLRSVAGIEIIEPDLVESVASRVIDTNRSQDYSIFDSVASELKADVFVTGIVEKFGVRRAMAGDPNSIGYRAYTYSIELNEIEIVQIGSGAILATLSVNRDSVDRPIQFNLFGKPQVQDREFRELLSVSFASKRFFEMAFGIHVQNVFEELTVSIVDELLYRGPIVLGESAKVLAIDGEEVFIGLGKEDLVQHGDTLPLLELGHQVGVVRVKQILGPHLSRAIVVDCSQPLRAGLVIGQRLVPGQSRN